MGPRDRPGRLAWAGPYRALTGAAGSAACAVLFAAYHGYLGIRYGSVWHAGMAPVYLLLAAIRGGIVLTELRNAARTAEVRDCRRRRTFRISALLLLALDLALMLPIAMMVVLARPVRMGLIPAIAMAAYTTWKVTVASVHVGRQRRRPGASLLVWELRTVNFIDALVSVLTLQNTLIMVNGGEDGDMLSLTAVSSAVLYAAIVLVTVRMLKKGWNGDGPWHGDRVGGSN